MRRALYAGCFMILAALPNCGNTTDSSLSAAAKPITLRTDSIGLTQVHTANATLIKLDGRFQNAVMIRRNADGTMTTECHNSQQAAEAFFQGARMAVHQGEAR
jgi:hypothetical protein